MFCIKGNSNHVYQTGRHPHSPVSMFGLNSGFLPVSCPYSHISLCLGDCTLCDKGLPSACLGFFF